MSWSREEGHDPQRRNARHRSRSGALPSSRRWRAAHLRAGERSADGPALLPVLIMTSEAHIPFRLLDLLQVVDRSFPTGAFVHSAGLEWLAAEKSLPLEDGLRLRLSEQLGR